MMMNPRWTAPVVTLIFGIFFWQVVCHLGDVNEPWDAAADWYAAYPLSVIISGLIAWFLGKMWYAGAIITFAQLPALVAANNDTSIMIGLPFLLALSLPAIAASALATRLRRRA
ncbi:hypothetical protein [Agrobacterium vaccinii]|uniref:hypothetical protein n=1 Tax=Agrobacterium vaccinii TaxID=2735528 RepID=UPI001E33B01F|nr:hypothetical protein [Agrobacterium vaccinii]UHS58898.1 hypothetical protein HRS00_18795 [Agrobacterium vaccinii]